MAQASLDDRGRAFRFYVPAALERVASVRVRGALYNVHRGNLLGLLISLGIAVVGFLTIYFVVLGRRPKLVPLTVGLTTAVGVAASGAVLARIRSARFQTTAREVMLADGLCPACLYELRGVPPEADGCRVCPECGGAWRMVPSEG